MQIYSNPKRAEDPHALPDVEVWFQQVIIAECGCVFHAEQGELCEHDTPAGWYWQTCFPGCLPDGEPVGPFNTQEEAVADAQEGMDDED